MHRDHSGLRLDMAPFCDPWDSGQVGWIYVEDDMARKELGITDERELTDEDVTHLFKVLRAETVEMDQYMSGEVYMVKQLKEREAVAVSAALVLYEDMINDLCELLSIPKTLIRSSVLSKGDRIVITALPESYIDEA